jgi:hypothetical protein
MKLQQTPDPKWKDVYGSIHYIPLPVKGLQPLPHAGMCELIIEVRTTKDLYRSRHLLPHEDFEFIPQTLDLMVHRIDDLIKERE